MVHGAKNATFLFLRGYMDYHNYRFRDGSLMIYIDGKLSAIMPANIEGETLHSHQGLTYGGLVMGPGLPAVEVRDIFKAINDHLSRQGIKRVVYKALPHIYSSIPSEEPLYALVNVCQARIVQRDISSAINLKDKLLWSRDRRYSAHRAWRDGVGVQGGCGGGRLEAFWLVLEGNLQATYGVRPVHSLEEISLLMGRFPRNIRLYTATHGGEVVGGTLLYLCGNVAHAQYISASPEGKRLRAIDAIYDHILNHETLEGAQWFDFGRSTEERGRRINEGLIHQKEGFGARGVCYDTYEWEL